MGTIPDRIFELIVLQLDHEQTADEEKELAAWLAEKKEHRQWWESYFEIRAQAKLLDRPFSADTEKALAKVKASRRFLRGSKKAIAWAAVLALPLCLGLWLLLQAMLGEENRLFSEVARPGKEKAILKIAAQRPIRLDGEIDTLIITENGTKIKTDAGNMLSFLIDSAGYKTAQEENQLIVPRGGEYRITLSDGTRVWLNAASVLTFPPVFAGNERKVRLVGEAFFEVTPDTARPFIVATARMDIKVLGTSFNVSVYEDEETVHTTLVKGSVEVQPVQQEAIMLKPGEQACLAGNRMTVKAVNTSQFTSWIDGKFMFCNTALEEISKQISRWYDVDIFFSSEQVKTICFTGAILRFEPLEELIRMIENTSNVRFSVKGKTIVISEQK
ncbi:MAG: FecR family protein [Odoribacter splanchnicus]